MVLCKFGPAVTVGPKFVTTPLAMSQHADTALRNCPQNVATIPKEADIKGGWAEPVGYRASGVRF